MGYYTRFELVIEPDTEENWDKVNKLTPSHHNIRHAISLEDKGSARDTCKWYGYQKDMVELSRLVPDITFTLYGEGEETGDIWYCDFRNGMKQFRKGNITFPKFSEDNWEFEIETI